MRVTDERRHVGSRALRACLLIHAERRSIMKRTRPKRPAHVSWYRGRRLTRFT